MLNYLKSEAYAALCWLYMLLKCGYAIHTAQPSRNGGYSIQHSRIFMYRNDLQQLLCIYERYPPFESGICPSKRWFTASMTYGRTGNRFEAYISLWMWAKEHPEEQVLQPSCLFVYQSDLCEQPSVPVLKDMSCGSQWPVYILPQYRTEGEKVARHFQALRHELRLKQGLRDTAQAILAAEELKMAGRKQVWWVSIHVRRMDYILDHIPRRLAELNTTCKYPPSVKWYVRAAVKHLRQAPVGAPRAIMLLSDDNYWLQKTMEPALRRKLRNSTHVVALLDADPDGALALMAAANSSIFDYGTFGMIGAILAGGNTTVYPLPLGISNHMNLIGHLPHWSVLK